MQSLLYLACFLCLATAWDFHTVPVAFSTPDWVQPSGNPIRFSTERPILFSTEGSVRPSGGPIAGSTPDWIQPSVQPSGNPIYASTAMPIRFSTERPILFSTEGSAHSSRNPIAGSTPNWVQPSGGPIFMSTPNWQPGSVQTSGEPIGMSTHNAGSVRPSISSDFSILPSIGPVRLSTQGTVEVNTPPAILAALQRLRASRHHHA